MDIDLLNIEPLPITEAASNEDLARALTFARQHRQWSNEGMSRFDIMEEIDPTFIHHAEHYEKMLQGGTRPDGTIFPSAKGIERVTFSVTEESARIRIDGSREHNPRKHGYTTTIQFENYGLLRKAGQLNWTERARLLLRDNLKVNCTCEAYRFFHQVAATNKGFALIPEHRPAPKNNPAGKGGVCKHLEHALKYLGPQYPKIASAMKQAHGLKESVEEAKAGWRADGEVAGVETSSSSAANHVARSYFRKGDHRDDAHARLTKMGYKPVATKHWAHGEMERHLKSATTGGHNAKHYTKADGQGFHHATVHTWGDKTPHTSIELHAHDGARPDHLHEAAMPKSFHVVVGHLTPKKHPGLRGPHGSENIELHDELAKAHGVLRQASVKGKSYHTRYSFPNVGAAQAFAAAAKDAKAGSAEVEESVDDFVDSLDERTMPAHAVVVRHTGDRLQTKLDHAKVRAIVKQHGGTHDGLDRDGDSHVTTCSFPNDTKAAIAHKAISDAGLDTVDRIVRNRTHDSTKVPMGEGSATSVNLPADDADKRPLPLRKVDRTGAKASSAKLGEATVPDLLTRIDAALPVVEGRAEDAEPLAKHIVGHLEQHPDDAHKVHKAIDVNTRRGARFSVDHLKKMDHKELSRHLASTGFHKGHISVAKSLSHHIPIPADVHEK